PQGGGCLMRRPAARRRSRHSPQGGGCLMRRPAARRRSRRSPQGGGCCMSTERDKGAMPAAPPPPTERLRALRAHFRGWLAGAPLADGEIPGMDVFERDATEVMSRQQTHRARQVARAACLVIVALVVWAAFARVDEVIKGDGRVVPSRQLQVLQSLDGGV